MMVSHLSAPLTKSVWEAIQRYNCSRTPEDQQADTREEGDIYTKGREEALKYVQLYDRAEKL